MLSRLSNGRLALLGLFASATSANLVFSGATIELNGDYYFIDPHVAGELPVHARNDSVLSSSYAAVTVVGSSGNATSLDSLLQSWTELDDVFTAEFLGGGVYIAHDSRLTSASTSTSTRLLNTTAPVYTLNDTASASALLPSGPYFLNVHTGSAHRALRLYDDHTSSFTGSLLQSPDGRRFQTLAAQRPTAMTLTVGVPSRLYYTRSALRPLAGLRLGVKDLYALRGARRSNGNRAWYHLYPDENMTAPAVQRLVDAGAVVVGYQSLAQFANGDHFAADAVDMQMPFNPRGDGYSVPLGSSSGAGASIAAYSWLDLALGSDTGGSVRNPAQVAGVFGNRPTTGLVTLDGVTPLSPTLDSPGFTARDPAIWDAAQQVLYGDNYTSLREVERPEYPKTIYTLDWPMGRTPELDAYFGSFLSAAAEITGAKVEAIDMHELWNRTRPAEVGDVDLSTYLNMTYPTLVAMEQSRLVRDPFFADYASMYNHLLTKSKLLTISRKTQRPQTFHQPLCPRPLGMGQHAARIRSRRRPPRAADL